MTPSFACEVWDNCGVSNSCKLERLQLEAARIITGLPIFTNTEYLPRYIEKVAGRDWKREELGESSNYSIISKTVAHTPYLLDHIPPTIQSRTIYPLRNGNDIIVPFCRLSLTRDFFVPATVREWNSLNLSVCNLDTLSKFKKTIRSSISMPIPRHYSYGPRKLNIIIPPLSEGGGGYTVLPLSVCPSFRPSKIVFVAFFSVTVDGRNLIFGHKLHIGIPYRGKRFWTHQIPTSCLPT